VKKYIALILGVLFILGFTASAFAIQAEIPANTQAAVAKGSTQITLGGEIRIRGEMKKNTAQFNDEYANTGSPDRSANYDQRIRLSLEAKVSPNTIGFIQLENGTSDVTDTYTWGTDSTTGGAKGGITASNQKRGNLYILQAWIQYSGSGLLGVPSGVKAGHIPLALGNGLFYDHTRWGDDAIVLFTEPTKELTLMLLDIKVAEGTTSRQDDADAYVFAAVWKPAKNTNISFDATYINGQNSTNGLSTQITGATSYVTTTANPYNPDLTFWNYGLRGDTEIAGFGIKADVEYQRGTLSKSTESGNDVKIRGLAYMLGVSYKVNPVKLSVEYVHGSGDSDGTTDNKVTTFITSLGGTQHYTYVYEYRTVNAANMSNGGIANTKYIKVGANADLTKSLNLDLGVYFLEAAKKVTSNGQYAFTNRTANESKKIGTEADAKITYKIDKGLQYWVEGGYLWAGKFWQAVTGSTVNPDDAYSVRHGIQLNF
jgi:hypothetical protein